MPFISALSRDVPLARIDGPVVTINSDHSVEQAGRELVAALVTLAANSCERKTGDDPKSRG